MDGTTKKGSAKNGGNARKTKSGELARVRWFNPKPDNTDREWLEGNADKHVELCLQILESIPDEGKLTVKYDVHSARWTAILFVDSNAPEYGLDALSVRGADSFSALCLCAYFHLVKFEGAWVGADSGGGGRWG